MQPLLVQKIALTFLGDAHALLTGFGGIFVKAVTAPIERMARACDVAGVYARRRQMHRATRQSRRWSAMHAWHSRRECLARRLNPFRGLRHLT